MIDNLPELGGLEREVMQLVWSRGRTTAEAVRESLSRPLKESTVRTVLHRLDMPYRGDEFQFGLDLILDGLERALQPT